MRMSFEDTKDKRIAFGKSLRNVRESLGLSLRELAAESGVDHSNIAQIERAERDPQLSTILVLAEALKINLSELLGGIR